MVKWILAIEFVESHKAFGEGEGGYNEDHEYLNNDPGGTTRGRSIGAQHMYYLYGSRPGVPRRLVATFDSEEQLLAYVRWATLSKRAGVHQFEKGSSLAGYHGYSYSSELRDER